MEALKKYSIKIALFLCLSMIITFGNETAASCSQRLTRSCYRQVSYVAYHTTYSMESGGTAYYACGWWGWSRCTRTNYYQTSSSTSVVRYRTEMYCCSGYSRIGASGRCEPECSPACGSGYTCVAPNTCRRGVQLMLDGVSYLNNSVFQFDSIYYTPDFCHSLLCTTDWVPCCSQTHSISESWYNIRSDESFISVPVSTEGNDYYQSRENDGTLRLIRPAGANQITDSVYCCQLLDATLTMQTLCVTIARHSPGVWLSLDSQLVPNNSAVELRDVYETQATDNHAHALMCLTLKCPCCKTPPSYGEWFYPNGSEVSIAGTGNSFYRDRGDDGTLRLHRRGITSLSAAMGLYCCEIPNASNVCHRLCVQFVDSSSGVWLMTSRNGQIYYNYTDTIKLILSEIFGKTSRYSLLCASERDPCCSNSSEAGGWYYQNGTVVPSYDQGFAFYTSRDDNGTVHLHTRDSSVSLMNTTQFCCKVLNVNDLSQKLCVDICNSDSEIMTDVQVTTTVGTWVPQVTPTVTRQIPSTKQTTVPLSFGALIGYTVAFGSILLVAAAIGVALCRYFSLKAKTTRNIANTRSCEVEMKHKEVDITCETVDQDTKGDENMYEEVRHTCTGPGDDDVHIMTSCPAYGTLK